MNYLQWLTKCTPTKFWHDSAIPSEIDEAIENGALGVTTNPVLTYKTLQAVPGFWQPEVDKIPAGLKPAERAEALLRMVATYAAKKFEKVFRETDGENGYALGQLDPSICNDSEKMIAQGLRYASWAENISVKTPSIKSALPLIEELASRGIAVCTTLNFSVSQAMAVGDAYMKGRAKAIKAGIKPKPIFVVQQGGRLDEYLVEVAKDNGIGIDPELIKNAGNAICKKVYRLFKERNIPAKVMPAGLRGVHHLTAMAGADMTFSLQARIQKMAIEADPERVCHIDEEIPQKIIDKLHAIPEFVRAYEEGELKPEEFISFGVTQKTLSQFLWTGWVPLETYQASKSDRWF
ncbi:MAG: transaldolase family protein [Spirochaetales bacterium]|nr:transaldolase family protein [Spirochaetales bacterium]MBQ7508328.1 transaldolase family protein [Spirochaetales bacterium]